MKTATKKPKAKAEPKVELQEVPKAEVLTPIVVEQIVPDNYKSKLTRSQIDLIKGTIAKGATDDELKMFLYVCERTQLDPFTRQIHLTPRWDSKLGKEVRTPITGIDGYRSIAERTGAYAGNDDTIFDNEEIPKKATVTVYKIVQGIRSPFTATARWEQYCPKKKDGTLASPLWAKMPHLMLGKCAEALALRKAFPAVMSGLYVAEEMHQAQTVNTGDEGQEDPLAKAKKTIANTTDVDGLTTFKDNLPRMQKYTAKEKKELTQAVEERLAKLTTQDHETETLPVIQSADPAGEESGAL